MIINLKINIVKNNEKEIKVINEEHKDKNLYVTDT